jgi:hypothetical protein
MMRVLVVMVIMMVVVMMVVVSGLLLTSLINSGALGNAVIVALPDNVSVCGEGEQPFDGLSDLNVSPTVDPGPNGQNIFTTSHTENSAANFVTGLRKLISNHGQKKILPISVRHTLLQSDDPFSTLLIGLVFPYWPNPLLEDVIVGNGRKERRSFEVRVYRPKALNRVDRGERCGRLLIVGVFRGRRAVPDNPSGSQDVLLEMGFRSLRLDTLRGWRRPVSGIFPPFSRSLHLRRTPGCLGRPERGERTGTEAEGRGRIRRWGRHARREGGKSVERIGPAMGAVRAKALRCAGKVNSGATLFVVSRCHRQRELRGVVSASPQVRVLHGE